MTCPSCHVEHAGPRDTFDLAEKLAEITRKSASEPDTYKALKFLHLNLLWLEGELRDLCANCTLTSAAERTAAGEPMPAWMQRTAPLPAPLPARAVGRVIDLGARLRAAQPDLSREPKKGA